MPRISEFYGIAIYMYYQDHLPPHFHALYAGWEAKIAIATGDLLDGRLPAVARRLVKAWVGVHRAELTDDWERARKGQAMMPIAPLE